LFASALMSDDVASAQTVPVSASPQNQPPEARRNEPAAERVIIGPGTTQTPPLRSEATQTDPPAPDSQTAQIESQEQRKEGDTFYADGYVNILYKGARLQADHVVYNQKTGAATAEGNVIYDPQPNQRIAAKRAELNIFTKTGTFFDATGYTDQTSDGGLLEFVAEKVEKTGADTYVLHRAKTTSCCEDANPFWTITAAKTNVKVNRRITARNAFFRIKGVPVLPLPFVAVPVNKKERQSGFLFPATGGATNLGRIFSNFYYQTLGDSADATFQNDIYTERGVGIGTTFRARLAEDSFIRVGTYSVIDRIFGRRESPEAPDQGGTLFFAKAVNRFSNGFVGVADVNFTSSFDFRAVFGNSIEDAFNPESKIILHLSKATSTFAFHSLLENRTTRISIPQANGDTAPVEINIRSSPSLHFDALPMRLGDSLFYASGEASLAGLRREERTVGLPNRLTFETPTIVQRLDAAPRLTALLPEFAGWSVTPSFGLRTTYYSASLDPLTALTPRPPLTQGLAALTPLGVPFGSRLGTSGDALVRNYADFSLDIRPPALEKIFSNADGTPRFKHVIEPYVTYRRTVGINDFQRILRFDALDILADTNEFEYALVNRILTPSGAAADGETRPAREVLSVTLSQKYFFDPTFGNALTPGQRNQITPILALSGFSYGGISRTLSPLNLKVRVTPQRSFFGDLRLDYDTRLNRVRGVGFSGGYARPKFQLNQSFYFSSQLRLQNGQLEPGTFDGNQTVTSFNLGDQNRGLFGGATFAFDLSRSLNAATQQLERKGLLFTSFNLGYGFRCASLLVNYSSVNLGVASAGRLTFAIAFRGLGTFGTEQSQQGARIRNR
jgi:LPS-assembly protein